MGSRRSPGVALGTCSGVQHLHAPPPPHPQLCLQRILQGLQHYQARLGSDIFATHPQPELKAVLEELLSLVQVS